MQTSCFMVLAYFLNFRFYVCISFSLYALISWAALTGKFAQINTVDHVLSYWEAGIAMDKVKERDPGRQREEPTPPLPLFIYTPKDSGLRFLAPKHTSRFLFLSEVPHSTKRLGDRAEASWGRRTSVHPPSLYMTFHALATSARRVYASMDAWQIMCFYAPKMFLTAGYVGL